MKRIRDDEKFIIRKKPRTDDTSEEEAEEADVQTSEQEEAAPATVDVTSEQQGATSQVPDVDSKKQEELLNQQVEQRMRMMIRSEVHRALQDHPTDAQLINRTLYNGFELIADRIDKLTHAVSSNMQPRSDSHHLPMRNPFIQ